MANHMRAGPGRRRAADGPRTPPAEAGPDPPLRSGQALRELPRRRPRRWRFSARSECPTRSPSAISGAGGSSVVKDIDGGRGDDTLNGNADRNTIVGGLGSDTINGNGGDDIIDAKTGDTSSSHTDAVDCGPGTADLAVIHLTDTASACDGNVDQSALGERPHVVLGVKRALARGGDGRLLVPVRCPKAVRHACKGTLAAAASEAKLAGAPVTRYRIPAGARRVVRVRPRPGTRLRGRVQLRSLEKGDVKGMKTTLRTARVR